MNANGGNGGSGVVYVVYDSSDADVGLTLSKDSATTNPNSVAYSNSITINGSAGLAALSALWFDGKAYNYTLTYAADGLVSDTQTVRVESATPTNLNVAVGGAGSRSGASFVTQPEISISNVAGNLIASNRSYVRSLIGRAPTGSTSHQIYGDATVQAVDGVARFTDLGITGPTGTYTVGVTAAGEASGSNDPNLLMHLDAGLSFSGSGARWRDLSGNEQDATLIGSPNYTAPTSSSQGLFTLSSSAGNYATAPNGFADFTGGLTMQATVKFRGTNSFERIADFGRGQALDNLIFSNTSTKTTLSFHIYRGGSWAGECLAPGAIEIGVVANFAVTLSPDGVCKMYKNGVELAVTTDTITSMPSNIARTSNLIGRGNWGDDGVSEIQNFLVYGDALTAQEVLANSLSNDYFTVDVAAGTASRLSLVNDSAASTAAAGAKSGTSFTTQPVVRLRDSADNLSALSTGTISAALVTGAGCAAPSGATLSGNTSVDAISGVATFSGLALSGTAGTYCIQYSSGSLTSATQTIALTAGDPVALSLTATGATAAAGTASGATFTTQPKVALIDAFGNVVDNDSASVSMAIQTVSVNGSATGSLIGTTSATATDGLATFAGTGISGVAGRTYRITYTSTVNSVALTPVTQDISVTPGVATQLAVTTQAAGMTAGGVALGGQPVVEIRDAAGNVVTGSSAVVTATASTAVAGASGTLATNTATAISGVATFSGMTFGGTASSAGTLYTITYSSGSLTSASHTITATPGPAVGLTYARTSGNERAGADFTNNPVITAVDASNNVISVASSTVTASVTGATLVGQTEESMVGGIATFSSLGISGSAGTYTLTFTSTLSDSSRTITGSVPIVAGPATQVVLTSAVGTAAGSAFTTQPSLTFRDVAGNTASLDANSYVKADITTVEIDGVATGSFLNGTTTARATVENGVATFSGLGIRGKAGQSYLVTYTTYGPDDVVLSSLPVRSQVITVSTGPATQLAVTTQAGDMTAAGTTLGVQPVIEVRDVSGNVVDDDSTVVTATATTSVVGAAGTLATNTATASNGVASFSGMTFTGTAASIGTQYTITYSATGLTSASHTITATQGPAVGLTLTRTDGSEPAGAEFTNEPMIRAVDASNNVVATESAAVTATVSGSATLLGQSEQPLVGGVTTFSSLGISGTVGTYTLTFTATLNGTSRTVQGSVPVIGGSVSLVSFTSAVGTAAGSTFTTQPSLSFIDVAGNAATMPAGSYVRAVIEPIEIGGTSTGTFKTSSANATSVDATIVNGTATFSGLGIIGVAGQTYDVTYTAYNSSNQVISGLPVRSQSITVTAGAPASMSIITDPGNARSGADLGAQPRIELLDAGGNRAASGSVTVTATSAPAGQTAASALSGTTTVSASNGVVTFTNLRLTGLSGGYVLTFTPTNSVTPQTKTVTLGAGDPTQMVVSRSAVAGVTGTAFTTQPIVKIVDAQGNAVETVSSTVSASIVAGANGTLVGVTSEPASAGVATFDNLGIAGRTLVDYDVRFSATVGATTYTVTQEDIQVSAGPAAGVELSGATTGTLDGTTVVAQSGVAFANPAVITVVDAGGNTVTGSTASVTASVSSGATLTGDTTVTASSGVATFTNLKLNGVNNSTYTLTFEVSGLPVATKSIKVATGPATALANVTFVEGASSGSVVGTAPVVRLVDSGNNFVSSSGVSVTASISSGATVSGASASTNGSGVATFSNLVVDGTMGTEYTLTFASTTLTSVSQPVVSELGAASKLAFVTQGSLTVESGAALATQPVIVVQDAGGNTVASSSASVVATVSSGGALVGTSTVNAVGGLASFTNLGLSGTNGSDYTVTFSSGSLTTTSQRITAQTGAATQLVRTTSASPVAAAGAVLNPATVVEIRDSGNNVVTSSNAQVTASISGGLGATLSGTTTVAAVNGVATFTDLAVSGTTGERPTITFSLVGTTSATLQPTISAGAAAKLTQVGYSGQQVAQSGTAFALDPVIRIEDAGGNLVVTDSNVTATVTTISVGGVATGELVGTTTVAAVDGVATFANLGLTGLTGRTYTITYSATGLAPAIEQLTVSTGPAVRVELTTQSVGTASGAAFTTQPVIAVRDSGGNTVTSQSGSVRATISTGGTLVGTTSKPLSSGVANFTGNGLGITGTAGTAYTITYRLLDGSNEAVAGVLTATQSVTVTTGAAARLALTTPGSGVRSGIAFSTQPVVTVQDSGGNTVTSSTASIVASVTPITVNGASSGSLSNSTVSAVDGVATFSNLAFSGLVKSGNTDLTYTITYTAASLPSGSNTLTQTISPTSGVGASLNIVTNAAGGSSGAAFDTQPVIQVLDSVGNRATFSTAPITASVSSGGELVGTTTVNAVNGLATFTNLGLTGTSGTSYTITFASSGLTSATQSIAAATGAPTQLRISQSSVGTAAGAAFTTQPQIELLDAGGNRVTSGAGSSLVVTASVTQVNVGGSLTGETVGTATATASSGVATFTNLGIGGKAGVAYTISYGASYSGSALTVATQSVTPTYGSATSVSIVNAAAGAVVGQPFTTQPRIAVLDSYGNTVTVANSIVNATISAGATLVGSVSRATGPDGIASFANLGARGTSGTRYTLSFGLTGFAPTTQDITLLAGQASRLTISRASAGVASGSAFATQPQIEVKDAEGNRVTQSSMAITATITQVDGIGSLVGTTTVNASSGVATFSNLGITGRAGTAYRVTYSGLGISSVTETLTVTLGAPTTLEIIDQAVGTASGATFTAQPRLAVKDLGGNIITTYSSPITATVSLSNGSVGGSLVGTTTVTPVNGIASFTNLGVTGTAGSTYRVTFTAGSLTATQDIAVTVGPATSLEITRSSVGQTAGARFTTQPQVTVRDAGGNRVTSSAALITASVSSGGSMLGRTSMIAVSGQVNFNDLGVDGTPGNTYVVTYSASGLASATQSMTLNPAEPGLVPVLGAATSTFDGFRFNITNFDPAYTFTGTATLGGRVTVSSTGVVTVSGLAPYTLATATITSTRNLYSTESASISARAAIGPAITPVFGSATATATGFTVQITNFNSAYVWRGTATAGGTVAISSTGLLTVTGVAGGTQTSATVTTTRAGYDSGEATTASVTTLLPGRTPLFATPTRTDGGYTVQITNFDANWTWTVTTTSGGVASIDGSGLVTVSGLPAGTTASALVVTARTGYSNGNAAAVGQALSPALVPVLGPVTATANGWTSQIGNYDSAFTWTANISSGNASINSSGLVTITGISTTANLTVSTSRTGYLAGSAATQVSLQGGLTPLFGTATSITGGFTVQVSNYDANYSWAVSATGGTATIGSTGLVTVTTSGAATVTVTTTRSGYSTQSASYTNGGTPGLVPTFGAPSSTLTGYTVRVTNYDPNYTWTFSATTGATATFDSSTVTVTVAGLPRGVESTLTASTNRLDYSTASASVTGTATPETALTPVLGTPSSTATGYTVQITNYDELWVWNVSSSSGSAEVDESGLVTVLGLDPGASATLTVTSVRSRYADGVATVSGSALSGAGLLALFGLPTATADGFTVQVSNYDSAYSWTVSASSGSATISNTGLITVTGLSAGGTSTVTVGTSRTGRASGSSTFLGGALNSDGVTPALSAGLTPAFSGVTRTATGFTTQITNYDSTFTWTATSGRGSTVSIGVDGAVTVTGLAANTNDTIVVRAAKSGQLTGSASVAGTSLATGTRAANLLSDVTMRAICPHGSPDLEGVSNVNDLAVATKYSCYTAANRSIAPYSSNTIGFATPNVGNFVVKGVTFTAASTEPNRDPLTYTLWGCAQENAQCTVIVSNDITGLTSGGSAVARGADGVRTIRNSRAFNFYRLTFGSVRGDVSMLQIGEVQLTGDSGLPDGLTPTFGTPTATSSGYTVQVSNFDDLYGWSVSVPAPGIAAISDSGLVTVTGLSPVTESTVTVSTSREGYSDETGSVTVTTSSGEALVPSITGVVPTSTGLTAVIENYDPVRYQWTAATTVSGSVVGTTSISSNGIVTVTGLTAGSSVRLTVSTTRASYLDGSAFVEVDLLEAGGSTGLSVVSPTDSGFTVDIDDYSSLLAAGWSFDVTATQGANINFIRSSGDIVVTNLAPGASATVTVTRTKEDAETVITSITGTASTSNSARTPEFGSATTTATGFTVQVTNFNADWTWSVSTSVGSATINSAGLITVTHGVSESPVLTVGTTRSGFTAGSATFSLATGAARTPTFGMTNAVSNGFTVQVTNYDAAWTWNVSVAPAGTATIDSAGLVTVSNIAAGVETTLTVRTTRTSFSAGSSTVSYTAGALTALTPTFGTPLSIVGGYTVQITNFDPLYTWTATSGDGATTSISSSGSLTVTNVTTDASGVVTVRAARTGYSTGTATVSGTARNLAARTPTFGQPIASASGFTAQITNYDAAWTWTASVDNNAMISISSSGLVTVTGAPGFSLVSANISAARSGYNTGTAVVRATTTAGSALIPVFAISTSTIDGYTVPIRNYDPLWTWTVERITTGAAGTVGSDGVLTVTGVTAGELGTVRVTASRNGYVSGAAEFSAVARPRLSTELSPRSVTHYQRTGNVATITTSGDHGFVAGAQIIVSGIGVGFDGMQTVAAAPTTTTLTFSSTGADVAITSITPNGFVQSANDVTLNVLLSPTSASSDVQAVVNIPYAAAEDGSQFIGIPALTEEYAAGYRVVQINGTDSSGVEIEDLEAAIRILFDTPAVGAVPVQSSDNGVTWVELPRLSTPELPAGQRDGYYVNSDGTVWILTRHLSMFGVLAEQAVPLTITASSSTLAIGESAQLTIEGGEGDGVLTVESLNPGVCTINASRVVTTLSSGTCSIRATKSSAGRFLEATTSINLQVGSLGGAVAVEEKPVVDEMPVLDQQPVVQQPRKKPTKNDSQSGGASTSNDSGRGDADEQTSDEAGLEQRIADAQELAKTPFAPGVDSPLPTNGVLVVTTENGVPVEVTVTVLPTENGLMIVGPDFSAEISTVDIDGSPLTVDDQGRVVLQSGTVLNVKVSGFAPNSVITLWLFSSPVSLGEFTVDSNGELDISVVIPESVTLGDHTVQLNGVSANGELRTMNVSVVVTQEQNALQRNLMPTILAVMAAIALASLVIARRRRVTTATGEVIDQP